MWLPGKVHPSPFFVYYTVHRFPTHQLFARRNRVRFRVVYVALLLVLFVPIKGSFAQPASPYTYFPQSGHTLAEPFRAFWQASPDPVRIFGYPISEPFVERSFTEPDALRRVQYFERAILEEQPVPLAEAATRPTVVGRLLGAQLVRDRLSEASFLPVVRAVDDPTFDAITQHTIVDTPAPFRQFWERMGGLAVFGRPLSEQFEERNAATGKTYWVQYFERQRMEWHPENSPAFQIQLGLLGAEYHAAHATTHDPAMFRWRNPNEPPSPTFAYGFNTTMFFTNQERAAAMVKEAGFGWVRQQVLWRDMQDRDGTIHWADLDKIVEAVDEAGLKLLLDVVQAPDWAAGGVGQTGFPDAAHRPHYGAFLAAVVERYGSKVAAFEIWNEMNLASENGGRPVPPTADYVELLIIAYNAIKAVRPETLVISGGAGPTEWRGGRAVAISDLQFYREMFADPRFWTHIDHVGVHVFGYGNPPETLWPEAPGPGPEWVNSGEFYFRRIEAVRALMVEAGHPEKQMWMTEFGWATANNSPLHQFGNNNSYEQQAAYLRRAFEIGRSTYTPWLGAMMVWNLNFAVAWEKVGDPLHEQAAYGTINSDWSPRPAYRALADMPKW
jgi:polysaccharide biosynthesis protein PslG